MPVRSGGKLVLVAPGTGELILADEATAAQQLGQGYQPATPEDVERHNTHEQYGTVAQQSLAQAERVVRGATLGQVEGIGSDEDIRARADLSQEEHPYISLAADVAPDVALAAFTGGTSSLATGAGRLAAREAAAVALKEGGSLGLRGALGAAAKAAPRAAMAGEALAGGAVAASQEAFQEGRQFLHDDPLEDASNTLFWAGLGGALSAAPLAVKALRSGKGAARAATEGVVSEAELQAARESGELARAEEAMLPEQAGARTRGEPTTSDPETIAAYEQAGAEIPPPSLAPPPPSSPVNLAGRSVEDLKGLPIEDTERAAVDALKADEGFANTGRVASNDGERGITLIDDGDGELVLRDGRHRLTAAQELDRESVWGRVVDGKTGEEVFQGEIPLKPPKPPEVTPGSAERAAQAANDNGVARAEREAMKSQAEDVVDRVTRGESPLKEGGGWARDAQLARFQPEIIEVATKEARGDLNELNKLSQGIRERAVKHSDVAKNISDNLAGQQSLARDIALEGQRLAGSIRADAHAMAAQMGKSRPQYFSATARDVVSTLMERTKAISKLTNGAEIFNQLDDLKRVVDAQKVALEQGSRRTASDPLLYQQLIPQVEEFANRVRSHLENTEAFGRAGEMQKAYNATYHQKWFPAKQVFEDSVFKVTGRDYKAFSTMDAWESKITSLLQSPNSGERRHVVDMLDALKEMAEQRAHYGTASKAETGRIVELVDKIHRTFGLADETGAAVRRMQDLGTVASGVAGVAGFAFGGPVGAVLAGGLAKGAGEFATGRFRNAFGNLRAATTDMVDRSVDDWIATSRARGGVAVPGRSAKRALSVEDQELLKTAKRRGTTIGFSQFLGDDDSPQSAFATKRDALMDDEKFAKAFSAEFGEMAHDHPQTYLVAAGKAAEVRKFLLDRIPAGIAISMRNPKGYPPTNESIEDWSVYYNAATNPRSVFQSLSRGDLRPQEVETLRTLYQPRYEQLQSTVLQKITAAAERGDDLDDQFLMRMNLLFDLDGAGSPAFSQRAADVARNYQDPAAQSPTSNKPFAAKLGSRVSPSNVAVTGPTYGTVN